MPVDLLLRPGRINTMVTPHRIITGPMEKSLANRDGSLTQRYVDYLVERARGGAGLIQVESTYIDTRGMGHLYQVGCHGDHVIPALARMAKAVHSEGAKVGLELYMGGRQTPAYMSQRQPIAPSVIPCKALHPVPIPREMTHEDIDEVITLFASAARRVLESGIDMIHLHGAHGYLLCGFLSPYSNKRTDEYGGSLANRARFPLKVLAAVRDVVGAAFPIGYRITADEYIEGGLTVDETAPFCVMLAEAGVDLVDVSGGIYESFPMIIQGPESPKGGFVSNAAAIKRAVGDRVPVSVAQRLNDPDFANEMMRREGMDFVSLTRAFHADPHYVRKISENRVSEIVPCMACHQCTNLLEANRAAGCAANPQTSHERERRIRPVLRRRSVLIAGGGPAGMQAARILAEQGNQVTLHEASDRLGGQIKYSARVASDYGNLITYLAGQLAKLKVNVRLNSTVTISTILESAPDAVVIAAGATGGLNFATVLGTPPIFDIFSAMDWESNGRADRLVLAGADAASCWVALHLAKKGSEVHIVDAKTVFAEDKLSPGRELLMMSMEAVPGIKFRRETTVEEIGEGYAVLQHQGAFERLNRVSAVIVGGRRANNYLYEHLLVEMPSLEIYNIGDSTEPRDVYHASADAAVIAERIRLRAVDSSIAPESAHV